jgi:ribonuclease HI
MITIFTDGSSRGNPGPGGWGAVVVQNNKVTELGGREDPTTNNRMELMAAINGLSAISSLEVSEKITLNTDSSYVINGITKWVYGWQKKGWKTIDKKDVVNRDLWEKLVEASSGKKISWNYVGGHVGIAGNERCDEIATSFADTIDPKLFSGPIAGYLIPNILDISEVPADSQKKSSSKSRSKATAYSYVSSVNGVIAIDKNWKDCEARVKGKSGVRYKKALNPGEEREIVADFKNK